VLAVHRRPDDRLGTQVRASSTGVRVCYALLCRGS
jgi:hypothetical protein